MVAGRQFLYGADVDDRGQFVPLKSDFQSSGRSGYSP
jgi:hypothetical protein